MLIWLGKETIPYEVLVDERLEKDLEKVPKYIVEKFLKSLDKKLVLRVLLNCDASWHRCSKVLSSFKFT